MDTQDSMPRDSFDGDVRRAQENIKIISELREKLEILTEHVESRKGALEEEIEESLHEAIRNARDSLERAMENAEPKMEKLIQAKMDVIDKRMATLKADGLESVREEIKNLTPQMSKKVLYDVDQIIVEKVKLVKDEIINSLNEEIDRRIKTDLAEFKEHMEKEHMSGRIISYLSFVVACAAIGMALLL
jgi:hypothetical protein